ncbi:hypothetical protein FHG87_021540 [Trinorchestia longiramus]|nr:hypothetical protein FHG87_021540 [Trinorchestia longiramus]
MRIQKESWSSVVLLGTELLRIDLEDGVGVMQTKNELLLEQSAYTKALLSRFGIDKANSVSTPVDINADLVTTSDEVEECDEDLYQSAVETENVEKNLTTLARSPFGAFLEGSSSTNQLNGCFSQVRKLVDEQPEGKSRHRSRHRT